MFTKGSEATYKGMCGIISFVGDTYIIFKTPPASSKHNSALLLIYPQDYKKVQLMKDSEK